METFGRAHEFTVRRPGLLEFTRTVRERAGKDVWHKVVDFDMKKV
jgi:hypothetical protein